MQHDDATLVATIHAISWRSAYRGILSDEYLNEQVDVDRLMVWRERLATPLNEQFGFVVLDDDRVIGFVFARANDDARWGTLVDNIHVLPDCKGRGAGRALMQAAAREAERRDPGVGLYLWVFEANAPSRAFYSALGGEHVEHVSKPSPDGRDLPEWRIAWSRASALFASAGA